MPTVRVDPDRPDPDAIDRAAAILRGGGLVAFPTETVYGLGANALDEQAVRSVFEAKGRPAFNPLIVHVADAAGARRLVRGWTATAARLADRFWPGPLTLVLPRRDIVPAIVTGGLPHVAIRVPAHPVALALIRAARVAVVAPSANLSTSVSPTRAQHVERAMDDRVGLILDGGPTRYGIESTVISLAHDPPLLLRPGALAAAEIEPFVGGHLATPSRTDQRRHASPGMLERHYAPRARLVLFGTGERDAASHTVRAAERDGLISGALVRNPMDAPLHHPVIMPGDASGYAARLYDELHRLDHLGCDLILVEMVPDEPAWDGVRDRLLRASTRDGP